MSHLSRILKRLFFPLSTLSNRISRNATRKAGKLSPLFIIRSSRRGRKKYECMFPHSPCNSLASLIGAAGTRNAHWRKNPFSWFPCMHSTLVARVRSAPRKSLPVEISLHRDFNRKAAILFVEKICETSGSSSSFQKEGN